MPSDPVPYVPLSLWRSLIGKPTFSHAALAIELQKDGQFAFQDEFTLAKKMLAIGSTVYAGGIATIASVVRRAVPMLESHSSTRYLAAIESAAKKWSESK